MAWSAAQGGDGGRARPGSAQGRRQHRERSISGPAAPPWVAFGHFISPFGSVIHSAQTEGKGSIRSKAPSAKQGAELATPAREHAEHTAAPQSLPAAAPEHGEDFKPEASRGCRGRGLLKPQLQPCRAPPSPAFPSLGPGPPSRTHMRGAKYQEPQQAAVEPPRGGRAVALSLRSSSTLPPFGCSIRVHLKTVEQYIVLKLKWLLFPVAGGGRVPSSHRDENKRPQPRATGFPHVAAP